MFVVIISAVFTRDVLKDGSKDESKRHDQVSNTVTPSLPSREKHPR